MSTTAQASGLGIVEKDSLRGWLSWLLVALFFLLDYCLKNSIGALGTTLINDYHFNHEQFAKISSAYPLAYLFLQIPAGILVDRYGPRWVITFAALSCALGCLLFSNISSYPCMIIGRSLIGAGAAFSLVTCSKIATICFPPRRFVFLFGIMMMIASSGGFIGLRMVIPLIDLLGWEQSMYFSAIVCALLAIFMLITVRNTVDGSSYQVDKQQTLLDLLKEIYVVMTSKQAWLLALFAGFMFIPTTIIATWGPQVLVNKFQIDDKLAPQLTSWLFMGWILGSPLQAYISDCLGRRLPVMIAAVLFTILFSTPLIVLNNIPENIIIFSTFAIGLSSCGLALAFTLLKESYSKDLVGAAMGFINTMNTLFEYASIIVAGWAVSLYSHYTLSSVDSTSFEAAFFIIPLSLVCSATLTLFIKDRTN